MAYEIFNPGMQFGGSNNWLALAGGVGNDWGLGLEKSMGLGQMMLNYQKAVAMQPSSIRAGIAHNINQQSSNELDHYQRLPVLGAASQALGGNTAQMQDLLRMWGLNTANGGVAYGANSQATPMSVQTGGSLQTTPAMWKSPASPSNNNFVHPSQLQGYLNTTGNQSGVGL